MERVVEESVAATRFTDIAVIVNDDDKNVYWLNNRLDTINLIAVICNLN